MNKKKLGPKRQNLKKLEEETHQQRLNQKISETFQVAVQKSIDDAWTGMKSALLEAGEEIIGKEEKIEKRVWMTEEILKMIGEKGRYKSINKDKYVQLKRRISYEIRKAKENWMEENCSEIEDLKYKHGAETLHRILKDIMGNTRSKIPMITRNEKGEVQLTDTKKTWEKYIKMLFSDDREELDMN